MEWVAVPPVIAVAALLAYLHPDSRKAREYEARLAARQSVGDDELFHRFFEAGEVKPDEPGRVRRAFAKHTGYPVEKMLPDDDLAFFWADLDMVDLVHELEQEFGIEITDADVASVLSCTIRAVSHLMSRKAGRTALMASRLE